MQTLEQQYQKQMDAEQPFERRRMIKKIRVRVHTNRNVDFITAMRPDALISQLANRCLSIYLELTEGLAFQTSGRKQLTVAAVKQGIFYMPKSQCLSNLLTNDDEVEVVIVKAKPKYPNQIFRNLTANQQMIPEQQPKPKIQKIIIATETKPNLVTQGSNFLSNKQIIEQPQKNASLSKIQLQKKVSNKQQNKRDKKKRKIQMKRKIFEEAEKMRKNVQKDGRSEGQNKIQEFTKKKIKIEKEEKAKSPERNLSILQISIPSPKIIFHNDPKIESPKLNFLNESGKKKFLLQGKEKYYEINEKDKKNYAEKIVSPLNLPRSFTPPFLPSLENIHHKDKKQFHGFALPRKGSEDKREENRKESKEKIESIQGKQEESEKKLMIDQITGESKIIENSQIEQKPLIKNSFQFLTVMEAEDSQSQENKKISNNSAINHRQKQLQEIHKRMSGFLIQSDED